MQGDVVCLPKKNKGPGTRTTRRFPAPVPLQHRVVTSSSTCLLASKPKGQSRMCRADRPSRLRAGGRGQAAGLAGRSYITHVVRAGGGRSRAHAGLRGEPRLFIKKQRQEKKVNVCTRGNNLCAGNEEFIR